MNTLNAGINTSPYYYRESTMATPLPNDAPGNRTVLMEQQDASKSLRMRCTDSSRGPTASVLPPRRIEAGEGLIDIRCSAETNSPIIEVLIGEEPTRKTSRNKIPRVLSEIASSEICPPYCSNLGHKHLPSIPSPLRNCETASERSPVRESPQRAGWVGATWRQLTSWTKILWSPILGHKKYPSNSGEDPKKSRNFFGRKQGATRAQRTGFSGLASTYDGSSREGRILPSAPTTRARSRSKLSSKEYIRVSASHRYIKRSGRIANFIRRNIVPGEPINSDLSSVHIERDNESDWSGKEGRVETTMKELDIQDGNDPHLSGSRTFSYPSNNPSVRGFHRRGSIPRFPPRAAFNLGPPVNGTREVVTSTTLSPIVTADLQGVGNLTIEEAVRNISYQRLDSPDANQNSATYNGEQEEAYRNETEELPQIMRVSSRWG